MVENSQMISPEERVLEMLSRRSFIVRFLQGGRFAGKFSPTGAWLRISARERWYWRLTLICVFAATSHLPLLLQSDVFELLYVLLMFSLLFLASICAVGFKRDLLNRNSNIEGRLLIVKMHWISSFGFIALLTASLYFSYVVYRAYLSDNFSSLASLGVTLVISPPLLVILVLEHVGPYYIPGPGSGYIPRVRIANFFGRLVNACLVAGIALLGLELIAPIVVGDDTVVNLRGKLLSYFVAWVLAFLKGVGKFDETLRDRRYNLVEELYYFAHARDALESGDSGAGRSKMGMMNLFKFVSRRCLRGDKRDSQCSGAVGGAPRVEKFEKISRVVELSNQPVIRGVISTPLVPRPLVEAFIVTQFRRIFGEETLKALPRSAKELTARPGGSSEYDICVNLLREINERSGATGFMNEVLCGFYQLYHPCDNNIEDVVFEEGDDLIVVDLIYRAIRMPMWW